MGKAATDEAGPSEPPSGAMSKLHLTKEEEEELFLGELPQRNLSWCLER